MPEVIEDSAEIAAPARPRAAAATKRVPQLDGLRGVAILLVLVCHYLPQQIHAQQRTIPAYVQRALAMSWRGVDLFFVLSGFLITGILLDNCKAGNYFRVFYIRRTCRIFPLYFFWLALFVTLPWVLPGVAASCNGLFDHPMPLWSYATFTQNYWMPQVQGGGAQWLAITWSLAVEEQFYLLLPLIVFCLPRRALPWCFGLMVILAPILRLLCPSSWAFLATPCRADSLLAGSLLALGLRRDGIKTFCGQNLTLLYAAFGVLLAGLGYMIWRGTGEVGGALTHSWLAALFSVALVLSLVHADGLYAKCLRNSVLVWLGAVSYGVYMFHQAVNGLLHGLICGTGPRLQNLTDAMVTALALVVTMTLAALSFFLVERRIISYGHSFKYENRTDNAGCVHP